MSIMSKKKSVLYLALLLFCILPYDYESLVSDNIIFILSIVTNVVKLLLIVYVLLYAKQKKLSDGESRLNKIISFYFITSIVANLIVPVLGDDCNLYMIITRTLSLLFVYCFIIYLSYNTSNMNNYFRVFMNVSIVLLVASILTYFFYFVYYFKVIFSNNKFFLYCDSRLAIF